MSNPPTPPAPAAETPTPRTDQFDERTYPLLHASHKNLERDLAARDAEVKRLREQIEQLRGNNFAADPRKWRFTLEEVQVEIGNKTADLRAQLAARDAERATLRALLVEVKEHHALGLEHVKNQERTLDEYAKEVADLRAQLTARDAEVATLRERGAKDQEMIRTNYDAANAYMAQLQTATERAERAEAELKAQKELYEANHG